MELYQRIKFGELTENTCAICMENIREKEIFSLPCKHIFHQKCFGYFMGSRCEKNCPTCRAPIATHSRPLREESVSRGGLTIAEIMSEPEVNIDCEICKKELNSEKEE